MLMKILFDELVEQYNSKMEYVQDIIDFFNSAQELVQDPKKERRQIIVFWKKNRIYKALERISDKDKLRTDLTEKEFDKETKIKFFKALQEHEKCELIALKLAKIDTMLFLLPNNHALIPMLKLGRIYLIQKKKAFFASVKTGEISQLGFLKGGKPFDIRAKLEQFK